MTATATTGTGPAPATDRAARWRLAALGLAFLAAAVVTYVLAVRRARGQLLDEAMKAFWLPLRRDVTDLGHDVFRLLGWPLLLTGIALVVVTCVARRDVVLAAIAGAILLGGPGIVWLSQRALDRPISDDRTFPLRNTLPSGHASVAAAVALVVLLLAKPAQRRLALVGAVALTAVGVLGPAAAAAHRPSDVAAAYLVVGAWTAAVLLLAGRGSPAAHDAGPSVGIAAGALAVAAVALTVIAVLVAQAADHIPETTNLLWLCTLVLLTSVGIVVVTGLAPALLATGIPGGSRARSLEG